MGEDMQTNFRQYLIVFPHVQEQVLQSSTIRSKGDFSTIWGRPGAMVSWIVSRIKHVVGVGLEKGHVWGEKGKGKKELLNSAEYKFYHPSQDHTHIKNIRSILIQIKAGTTKIQQILSYRLVNIAAGDNGQPWLHDISRWWRPQSRSKYNCAQGINFIHRHTVRARDHQTSWRLPDNRSLSGLNAWSVHKFIIISTNIRILGILREKTKIGLMRLTGKSRKYPTTY